MAWAQQAHMTLGRDISGEKLHGAAPDDEARYLGKLPESLRVGIERLFGCPYESRCMLAGLAADPLPAAIRSALQK